MPAHLFTLREKTGTIEEGVTMAERLIDSGAAAAKLEEFIRESNA